MNTLHFQSELMVLALSLPSQKPQLSNIGTNGVPEGEQKTGYFLKKSFRNSERTLINSLAGGSPYRSKLKQSKYKERY